MARFDLKTLFAIPTAQERIAGLHLRPDLASAAVLLVATEQFDTDLARLESVLADTESVLLLVEGRTARRLGLLVLTTERILFRPYGTVSGELVTVHLRDVAEVESRVRTMTGEVRVRTPDTVLHVDRMLGKLADQFAAAVRREQSAPTEPAVVVDPMQELIELRARHAAGDVTDAEYEARKSRLLRDL